MASASAAVGPAVSAIQEGVAANAAISQTASTAAVQNTAISTATSATTNAAKAAGEGANNTLGTGASLIEKGTKPQ